MKHQDETLLTAAIDALKTNGPSSAMLAASARRVSERLGVEGIDGISVDAINSCGDVQHLLSAYRTKTLSKPQSLMVEAHLCECLVCFHKSRSESAVLDWAAPKSTRAVAWRPQAFGWALAATLVLSG